MSPVYIDKQGIAQTNSLPLPSILDYDNPCYVKAIAEWIAGCLTFEDQETVYDLLPLQAWEYFSDTKPKKGFYLVDLPQYAMEVQVTHPCKGSIQFRKVLRFKS